MKSRVDERCRRGAKLTRRVYITFCVLLVVIWSEALTTKSAYMDCCPSDDPGLCLLHVLRTTREPPHYPETDWLRAVHCLAQLMEYELSQPQAAGRIYLSSLQAAADHPSLIQGLGLLLQRHPLALYASTPSELCNDTLCIISPPAYHCYGSNDSIPVQIQPGLLPPPSWWDMGLRVCSWFDDYVHLPTCHPSFTVQDLKPGWHRLYAQAYGLISHEAIGPLKSVDVCVGDPHQECLRFPFVEEGRVPQEKEMKKQQQQQQQQQPSLGNQVSGCLTIITIVLNGLPFLDYHLQQFLRLSTLGSKDGLPLCRNGHPWQWHIVEGLAIGRANKHRPYSVEPLPEEFHHQGLSVDGTTEWLEKAQKDYPDLIHVHRRRDGGGMWVDKVEMLNYVLGAIQEETILVEVDVDELWTADQLLGIRDLLLSSPAPPSSSEVDMQDGGTSTHPRDCAYFDCHFMVGPQLLTLTPGGYGHSYDYEWLRAWRYRPGMFWLSHAPPMLMQLKGNKWEALQGSRCYSHDETMAMGLVFTHYAYAMENQVKFKEAFYGYPGAVDAWRELQSLSPNALPVNLSQYLPWLYGAKRFITTMAGSSDRPAIAAHVPIVPLPPDLSITSLEARSPQLPLLSSCHIHVAIDLVVLQMFALGITRVWLSILPLVLNRLHQLFRPQGNEWVTPSLLCVSLLQRGPQTTTSSDLEARLQKHVMGLSGLSLRFVRLPPYIGGSMDEMLLYDWMIANGVNVFMSTLYSRGYDESRSLANRTPAHVALLHDLTPERLQWDMRQDEWAAKIACLSSADVIITVSNTTARLGQLFYPDIWSSRPVIPSHNGVDTDVFRRRNPEAVRAFLKSHGLDSGRPYVLIVGARMGYKGAHVIYRTLQQYSSLSPESRPFSLLLVGGAPLDRPDELELLRGLEYYHLPSPSQEELALAYSGALALMYLSLDEGSGLPVLEAMACGCPILFSHTAEAIYEAVGQAEQMAGNIHNHPSSSLTELSSRMPGAITVDTSSLSEAWAALRWVDSLTRAGAVEAARAHLVARARDVYSGWEPLAYNVADAIWLAGTGTLTLSNSTKSENSKSIEDG